MFWITRKENVHREYQRTFYLTETTWSYRKLWRSRKPTTSIAISGENFSFNDDDVLSMSHA